MTLQQIATLINTIKFPNSLGEDVTIADDLSNIDEGVDLSHLSDDDVKDYAKEFVVGVVNVFRNNGGYKAETFGLFHDEIEYGGILQVVRGRGRYKAYTTPILSLESVVDDASAPDYTDGHYYGIGADTKIYTKDVIDEIRYSIPNSMFKQSFRTPEDVQKLVSLIESQYNDTIASQVKELARSILIALINDCSSSRRIHLFTLFNTINGLTDSDADYVTLANYRSNIKFRLFAQETLQRIQNQMLDYNKKYNDGSIEIYGQKEDLRTIVLEDFATTMKFTQGNVYNPEYTTPGEMYQINYWQNASEDLIPCISATSVHDQVVIDGGDAADTTINHVVGIVLDKYVAGITNRLEKTRAKYVPEGDFTTMFHAIMKRYWIDNRDMAVIFTLD